MRANAADYGLDPDRIAIGGASSGGHLASLALTASDEQLEETLATTSTSPARVVAYFTSSDLLLSGRAQRVETQVAPPPAAALLGLDRIDDDPERRNPKPDAP